MVSKDSPDPVLPGHHKEPDQSIHRVTSTSACGTRGTGEVGTPAILPRAALSLSDTNSASGPRVTFHVS